MKVKVAQLCLTLCSLMDYTVHGIIQARILEWVAYPFSSRSFWPRNRTRVSCIAGRFFTNWAIREALRSLSHDELFCDPMDYIVHRILQARILEWLAFPFSSGFSQPRDWTQVSCIAGRFYTNWTTGKTKNTGVGSLSLLQQISLTQGLNQGLLHCR